jgi:hypothetical protein
MLEVQSAVQAQTADTITLVRHRILVVSNATQAQPATNVFIGLLTTQVALMVEYGDLGVRATQVALMVEYGPSWARVSQAALEVEYVSTIPVYFVVVDWDGDGVCESNEAPRMQGLTISRGRFNYIQPGGDGFERQEPGKATIMLDNADGRFDPYNASGPNYGHIKPGRRVEIWTVIGIDTYWLFHGWLDDIIPAGAGEDRQVRLEARDGWRWLLDRKPVHAILTNVATDNAIGHILDAADWPAAMGRTLGAGSDVLPYWWTETATGFDAIHNLVESELGRVFVAADGKLTFVGRLGDYNGSASFTLTNTDLFDMVLPRPWEVLRNVVRAKCHPAKALIGVEIWRLGDTPLIASGQSLTLYADFTSYDGNPLAATAITAAVGWVVPVEGTTPAVYDFRANTAEDESGTDCTPAITVVVTLYAETSKVVVTNTGTVDCYITEMRLRGDALDNSGAASIEVEDATSKAEYGPRVFTLDLPWQQSLWETTDFANWLKFWLKDPLAFPTVVLLGQDILQLSKEIGTRLTLTVPSVGIGADFRIAGITHDIQNARRMIKTKWFLEPVDMRGYWQFTTAIGTTSIFAY